MQEDKTEALMEKLGATLAASDFNSIDLVDPLLFVLADVMAHASGRELDEKLFVESMFMLRGMYRFHCNALTETPDTITIQ